MQVIGPASEACADTATSVRAVKQTENVFRSSFGIDLSGRCASTLSIARRPTKAIARLGQ
jgi:hypothetical protein